MLTITFLWISTLFCCSKANPLIGGNVQRADIRELPFIVSVGQKLDNGAYFHVCGGALISRRHVLTVEQCLLEEHEGVYHNPQQLLVRIGNAEYARGASYEVESFTTFDQWDDEHDVHAPNDANDIAILRLHNAVNEGGVTPGRLTDHPNNYFIGKIVQTAGWGAALAEDGSQHHLLRGVAIPDHLVVGSPHLQKVSLRVLRPAECLNLVESSVLRRIGFPRYLYRVQMCTTGTDSFTLMGDGDSGSPLMYGNEIIGVNEGVIPQFGDFPSNYHSYQRSIHVGIAPYRQFIDHVLQN